MPFVERPDGVEIHWQVQGQGPLVLIAPPLWSYPEVYSGLAAELARDHRVVFHDPRGCGRSTRRGPFDPETDAADLAAVIEACGGRAVVIAIANGFNVAARVGAARPQLISRVIAVGPAAGVVLPRSELGDAGVLASHSVAEMLLQMLDTDPRAGAHAIVSATNPQLGEDELHRRVDRLISYSSIEAAGERARAMIEDEMRDQVRALGGRLWVLHGGATEPLFDPVLDERVRQLFPEARLEQVEGGPLSRPDLFAAAVRRIAAGAAAGD